MEASRLRVVALARAWIGTPYHPQASLRHVGSDCVGLVRGVYGELSGREVTPQVAYTADWAEASGEETLRDAARRHLVEIAPGAARPGDVLLFRCRDGFPAKHAGILATPVSFIHAMEGVPVSEVALCGWWRRRIVAAFVFPDFG